MASKISPAAFGTITLDGVDYIERPQIFAMELTITQPNQVFTNQRLTLPGVADFLLKGLTRQTFNPTHAQLFQPFRFRMLNGEGSTWFFSGGLGLFDDRVIDLLVFGTAQFPYMLIPPVPVHASGSLIFEVEDIGEIGTSFGGAANYYPYTIYFGFHGSYLIPANPAQGG